MDDSMKGRLILHCEVGMQQAVHIFCLSDFNGWYAVHVSTPHQSFVEGVIV